MYRTSKSKSPCNVLEFLGARLFLEIGMGVDGKVRVKIRKESVKSINQSINHVT